MPLLQKLNMVTHKYASGLSIVTNQNKSVARESLKQKIWYLKTCWCQRLPFPVHFLSKIWRWYNVSRKMSTLVPGYVSVQQKGQMNWATPMIRTIGLILTLVTWPTIVKSYWAHKTCFTDRQADRPTDVFKIMYPLSYPNIDVGFILVYIIKRSDFDS